jgi:hypothetical protein
MFWSVRRLGWQKQKIRRLGQVVREEGNPPDRPLCRPVYPDLDPRLQLPKTGDSVEDIEAGFRDLAAGRCGPPLRRGSEPSPVQVELHCVPCSGPIIDQHPQRSSAGRDFLDIALIVIFGLLGVGMLLVIFGTAAKNSWGINLSPIICPNCNAQIPQVRNPQNLRQTLWGGAYCPQCASEVDKWGRLLQQPSPKR